MTLNSRLSKRHDATVPLIVAMAILGAAHPIAKQSDDASRSAETSWSVIQAYIDRSTAWQTKSGEIRTADYSAEERDRRLVEHRAKRPDIVPAVDAARILVEGGGEYALEAAKFLVERPRGLSPGADRDIELGLRSLKAIVGPDWSLVEALKRRYEAWGEASRQIGSSDIPDDERRKRKAEVGQRPKDLAATAAALAIADLGRGHEKSRQAAEFLIYPGAGKASPEAALMAARSLFEHFPDYDHWPFVLMTIGTDPYGRREANEAFFAHVAANANNPVVVANARYYSAAGLMTGLNKRSLPTVERDERRRQALEVATGLSLGVENVEFVGSRYDLGPGTATLAQAEAALVHGIRHATVGGTVANLTGRRLDGSEEQLSAYAGKTILLNFWATWCAPCIRALPVLRQLAVAYPKDRFQILAVSIDDDAQTVEEFMEVHSMPWSHWHVGPSSELVRRNWHVRSWPTYVVVDSKGEILWRTEDLLGTKAAIERALQSTESVVPQRSGNLR